jgi:DNA-binding NarL/FixJ family response regulator
MRVLVVDDNPVVRAGLSAMLGDQPAVSEVVEASNGQLALDLLAEGGIDMMFLDVRMPVLDGLGVLERMDAAVPVIMLTHSEEPAVIRETLRLGARGYLVHGSFDEAELTSALSTCRHGGMVLSPSAAGVAMQPAGSAPAAAATEDFGLTEREQQLIAELADGLGNAAIAQRLFLSEKTVKNHLNRIYAKMGVSSRAEAIVRWLGR